MRYFIFLQLLLFFPLSLYGDLSAYRKAALLGVDLKGLWIEISLQEQCLLLRKGKKRVAVYPISSAEKGPGQMRDSLQTPLGFHRIEKKIGNRAPLFTIFKSLQQTRRIGSLLSKETSQQEDSILTRVLTLRGLEKSFNKGFNSLGVCVDSKQRQIYIHGTPYEDRIGTASSNGCIRMKNEDICLLFQQVEVGTPVWIQKEALD